MAEAPASAPVAAKPAATVVLARDAKQGGIEIFLVQRHGSMGFMGGVHVFPGGKVSASDTTERMRARVDDADDAAAHALWGEGVEADGNVSRAVAAVRETFEESGILLAHDTRGIAVGVTLGEARMRLLAGEDFATLLQSAGMSLRLSMLVPLSRWITPESEPMRFDTNFYVARLPEGQDASHDLKESIGSGWLRPADALLASTEGRIRLAPPTTRTLESLRDVASVEAALALSSSRPPPVILPILRTLDNEVVVLYPGDPEHPNPEAAFDGATRLVVRRR